MDIVYKEGLPTTGLPIEQVVARAPISHDAVVYHDGRRDEEGLVGVIHQGRWIERGGAGFWEAYLDITAPPAKAAAKEAVTDLVRTLTQAGGRLRDEDVGGLAAALKHTRGK